MTERENRLGEFLRSRRLQTDPVALGVAPNARRRVGVRREDVAARAGLSVPYLARLEQGRDRHPSLRVVDALGDALALDEFELGHLRLLAGHSAPAPVRPAGRNIRPGLRMLMSSWTDQAAFVQDRYGNVLASNALAVALCPIFVPGTNVLRWLFLAPEAKRCYPDWTEVVERVVGDVVVTSASAPDDPAFRELIADLTAASSAFEALWALHPVRDKAVGLKRFRTESGETVTLNWESFNVSADMWLFVFFAEPGSPDQHALGRLIPGSGSPVDL